MTELKISVKGTPPRPWGSDEWGWRKAIADHAHEFRPQAVSHSKNSKFTELLQYKRRKIREKTTNN